MSAKIETEKIGVFICTGYGIGEALDIDALSGVATGEYNVPFCKTVDSCEGADLASMIEDATGEGLTKVLIAGISARKYQDHAFPEGVMVERLALLDHVVRCQPPEDEDTQMMAEDYLRMYITKLQKMSPPEPFQSEEPIDKTILVVGGGITGMTAALEAAETGYQVRLVEKTAALGGWLGKQHKSVPTKAPYRELEDTGIAALIARIEGHARIEVYTSAHTARIEGAPGLFDVTLNSVDSGDELASFRAGAIIQATGWSPKGRDQLPYTELEDVVRNVDLEEMVKQGGKIVRPSDGKRVRNIVFLQCGGSRDEAHHSYCSSICCLTSLKQALYLRGLDQDARAYIFYEFIRTPGQYEDFYTAVQEDPGVFLTKGQVTGVRRDGDGGLIVSAQDTMQGESIEVKADLVVLAGGMVPNSADGEAIRALESAKVIAETGEGEELRQKAAKTVVELAEHDGTEILNLEYRQGPDLPVLEWGFPASHFICFPYESRRTGIYAAGSLRNPMDGISAREDAAGAALKAIQCLEMTSRGEAVHPRAGDTTYPDFFLQRCTQCKRCTEECPFGTLNEDEKGTPEHSPTRCRRCGICLGACPERIVSFKDYSIDIVGSMIKAVEVPDEWDEKPRILVLMCENDAFPAMDLVGEHGLQYSPWIRMIPVRCLGSVNSAWVKEAFSAGYDAVILIGCKYGDDYQCHFIKGSELCVSRSDNIREHLESMAMESERVELYQLQISEYEKLPKFFNDMAEVIDIDDGIGLNPFKGL